MPSRLDQLFSLLEAGTTSVTRKAAASQLGELVRLHSPDLPHLLDRLHHYIISKSWDTRVAAGCAIRAIAQNYPLQHPVPVAPISDSDELDMDLDSLTLSSFNIKNVLKNGTYLSSGNEGQFDIDTSAMPVDRLKEQRGLINESLGLGPDDDTRGLITNDDLVILGEKTDCNRKETVFSVVQKEIDCLESSCISLKRSLAPTADDKELTIKRQKFTDEDSQLPVDQLQNDVSPFVIFCDVLVKDLFSATWETRHGAAIALKEIVYVLGNIMGKRSGCTSAQMYNDNRIWLEDKAVRTLSVIGMDRFVDFVSDDAVAPVRGSCSQLLGALVKFMSEKSIIQIQDMIHEMILWDDWGTRHGGMLALKYIFAVRPDLKKTLFKKSYLHIFPGLTDAVDDVIAEAASCFMPISNEVSSILDEEQMNVLLATLWNSLLEFDGISGALTSILDLLSTIFNYSVITERMTLDATKYVPNLFPFMYETSLKMRSSSLQTILSLLNGRFVQSASCSSREWLNELLEPIMIHVFQSLIIESHVENMEIAVQIWENILSHSHPSKVQTVAIKHYATWMSQLSSNPKAALESTYFKVPTLEKAKDSEDKNYADNKKYMLGCGHIVSNDRHMHHSALQAKLYGSKLLGNLANYAVLVSGAEYPPGEAPVDCFYRLLVTYLTSQSAWARHFAAAVLREWAVQHSVTCPTLRAHLLKALTESVYYDEVAWNCAKLQRDTKNFIAVLNVYSIKVGRTYEDVNILSFEQIHELAGSLTKDLIAASKIKKTAQKQLEDRREEIVFVTAEVSKSIIEYNMLVQSSIASAMVELNMFPDKLTPLVKPLMDSLRKEEVEFIQDISALSLPQLMNKCSDRELCPNSKIFKNLCIFLCIDETVTPVVSENDVPENYGIYFLNKQEETAKRNLARCSSLTGRPVGRPRSSSISTSLEACPRSKDEFNHKAIQRRGCTKALINMVKHFGGRLKTDLHLQFFYHALLNPLKNVNSTLIIESSSDITATVHWFQLLEVIIPYLPSCILEEFLDNIHSFSMYLYHKFSIIRHMAARALATLTKERKDPCMIYMVQHILPKLDLPPTDSGIMMKEGVLEYMFITIEKLQLDIVPFLVLLIVPLLARMSDIRKSIRQMSTQCFATLIRLYPLESGCLETSLMPNYLVEKIQEQRAFLDQLCDPSTLNTFNINVKINATLRPYQQRGVNWLAFLNRYNLHGVLCDDMGLGKTLQSICILASDHHTKKQASLPSKGGIRSLIICPSTLTAHWYYEFKKFVSSAILNPIDYSGLPYERKRLRDQIRNHDVVIASYKIVRNEMDEFFSTIKWNYVILDEGHIIKNGKTKASLAIKGLEAKHRLILTGTPIQNNVLELWSLFDFLMPGYLGSERQFNANFSRPILQSREAKASLRDQEAGVLAMERLHRLTLPFLLRRIKGDVLTDLPPKISQDYYCELSPLQKTLYEDFAKEPSCQQSLARADKPGQSYIFQSLQYLKRVCNHPKLAITQAHPKFAQIKASLKADKSSLCDIKHSAKMTALKQLLIDCGIGASDETTCSFSVMKPIVSPHRALIFCQLKEMIDIIETDLLKSHLPSVTYIRMDGSVSINLRHGIVQRFNSDPSIDLLLLTTQVGGLGLNLTGADTVIFVEHDWNPMRDLQAMDRAHRIGQKRVVNVYRLITKGTIEEKIMNLQKFKLMVAKTVINDDNSSLVKMGTDQLLDLFTLNQGAAPDIKDGSTDSKQSNSITSVLANLPELWDEGQYAQQYNFDAFLKNLSK